MFYDIFKKLCDDRGISCTGASAEIGLSNAICAKWKRTGGAPNSDTLVKIADYFNVSVDYLCGRDVVQPQIPAPATTPVPRECAEQLTQQAIDAIRKIGTMADEEDPFPSVWATTICSALRTAVDRLEIRLLDDQIANVPFHLPKEEEDDSDV